MLTHCGTGEIDTERLLLRPFCYEDAEDMLKYWISDPKIQSMYSEPVYSTSKGVIKKCGFTYEGTLRDYFYMDGEYVSRLYYSMLRSERQDMC